MNYKKSETLGILACPGGEVFTNNIIDHLKRIHVRRNKRRAKANGCVSEGNGNLKPPVIKIPGAYTRFPNGEFKTEILSSIRGMDVYIVQDVENHLPLKFFGSDKSYELNVNEHFFCLMVTVDAATQAGAASVTVVLPTYPYGRQHKKKGREGLTAIRIGQILEFLGVKRIITLDIHSRDISNGFRMLLLENLHASYQILVKLSKIINLKDPDLVMVAPDTGAVDRNKFYALSLGIPLAMLYKERDYSRYSKDAADNNIVTMKILGSVENKTVFMADDLLGTGSTLIKAMRTLKNLGAKRIVCAVSIPLFTAEATEHFEKAYREGLFYRIIGTNAVRHDENLLCREWYISADVSSLFARIISRLHHNLSLSELLDNRQIIQKLLAQNPQK